ncbi:MAG: tetratricopeptide repeat protein [bacterium]
MRKQILSLNILLLFTAFGMFAQNARHYYKVGEDFLENAKHHDAIDQFSRAIDIDPDYEKAFELRAKAYEKIGNLEPAREDYEKLSIFDEKNEEYYFHGARMSFALEDFEDALVKINKALEEKRIFPEAQELKVLTLMELENYDQALEMSKEALKLKETDVNLYNYARVNELLGAWETAKEAYKNAIRKNKTYYEAYVKLADLQRKTKQYGEALENVNKVLGMNKEFLPAYRIRSAVYADQLNYSAAINDISTILLKEPENAEMYFLRGTYYQGYAQHMNAISDFSKVISLEPDNAEAYYKRGQSYEQSMQFKNAIKDYRRLASIVDDDDEAIELLSEAQKRLFELNRENNKPVIKLLSPEEVEGQVIQIPGSEIVVPIIGQTRDESNIQKVIVNGSSIPFTDKENYTEFLTTVNIEGTDRLKVEVVDEYDNSEIVNYSIVRTEETPPSVKILAPYASDNNTIWLESDDPTIYVEGEIEDESLIKSIYIDDVLASYIPDDNNPNFQAIITIQNKDRFTVKAEDSFGNVSSTTFILNRQSAQLQYENPMGKTWVVFIENSSYNSFASLDGPVRDITLMKTALAKYTIHNVIHKKDMTKEEMERFFAIELRDLLRSNRVNSLLIWFAGHGKFIKETGYWVPVDAQRDDEFTYYSISALRASMESYPAMLDHTLVITDACESGPSFYQAMRSELNTNRSCNDPATVKLKSYQVFSSAGYELAVDESQFTKTFANVLGNNSDACIPIENIVNTVSDAVMINNQQKPQFGKIKGLEDENGTFFFIKK